MDEYIFTEHPESQNSRQTSKINLLQQEVSQLQDLIKDLEQMLRMNRDALKISLSPFFLYNQHEIKLKPSQNNDTISTIPDNTTTRELGKNIFAHIEQYYEDNTKLYNQITRLTKERNLAQSKVC